MPTRGVVAIRGSEKDAFGIGALLFLTLKPFLTANTGPFSCCPRVFRTLSACDAMRVAAVDAALVGPGDRGTPPRIALTGQGGYRTAMRMGRIDK